MDTYATLTQDTPATARKVLGFYQWKDEQGVLPKGTRVRLERVRKDRKVVVRPTLPELQRFEAEVDFDHLDDFTGRLAWQDLTSKKGLP